VFGIPGHLITSFRGSSHHEGAGGGQLVAGPPVSSSIAVICAGFIEGAMIFALDGVNGGDIAALSFKPKCGFHPFGNMPRVTKYLCVTIQ
jgi:hypothetical protein